MTDGGKMIEEGRISATAAGGGITPSRVLRRQPFHVDWANYKKGAIGGLVVLFLAIFAAAVVADSFHTIDEGSVGLYYVQGALDDRISQPGVHWAIPFVTVVEMVTIRPKTDTLPSIR